METRIKYHNVAPHAVHAMLGLEKYTKESGLEKSLIELVKMRASQINGCAYCLDMHSKDARAAGESEQRLYVLSAWREAPFYTERERAALMWTEALTEIATYGVEDDLYEEVRGPPPPKWTRGLCCPRSEGELSLVLGRAHVAEG